jgi:hypothetical protein
MSGAPWIALGVATMMIGSVFLHELSHAVAAALLADNWALDITEPATYAEYADDATWEPRAVGAAPYAFALVWAVGVLIVSGLPDGPWTALPWYLPAYVVVGGGFEEFRFDTDEQGERDTSAGERASD